MQKPIDVFTLLIHGTLADLQNRVDPKTLSKPERVYMTFVLSALHTLLDMRDPEERLPRKFPKDESWNVQ